MGGVGGEYSPPTPPENLVLRDCTVNHPLYAIALACVLAPRAAHSKAKFAFNVLFLAAKQIMVDNRLGSGVI
jgi:hypothetical protein